MTIRAPRHDPRDARADRQNDEAPRLAPRRFVEPEHYLR